MLNEAQPDSFQWKHIRDRLPTVSLSQALQDAPVMLATGLPILDQHLRGGLPPGLLTEVYGPPGSGKTAFAMHLAAKLLEADTGRAADMVESVKESEATVVWLQCSQPLPATRLRDMITTDPNDQSVELNKLSRVKTLRVPSLVALLALLLHDRGSDMPSFMTLKTRLLVIDDLTTLFNAAFAPEDFRPNGESQAQRRARITKLLAQTLQTLAASYQLTIVILGKLTTRVVSGSGATLVPSLGDAWQDACAVRLLFYRDYPPVRMDPEEAAALRYCAVQKVGGVVWATPVRIPMRIRADGFEEMDLEAPSRPSSSQRWKAMAPPSMIVPLEPEEGEQDEQDAEELELEATLVTEQTIPATTKRSFEDETAQDAHEDKRLMFDEVLDSEDEALDEVALEEEAERAI